jgi:hypothetical protein
MNAGSWSLSSLEFPCRPEAGASAAGIAGYFFCGGLDTFSVYFNDLGFVSTLADGEMRRADAVFAFVSEEVLDNAIFQAVKGNDCQDADYGNHHHYL